MLICKQYHLSSEGIGETSFSVLHQLNQESLLLFLTRFQERECVILLLKNYVSVEINIDNLYGRILIGNVDVLQQKCSNTMVRKALGSVSFPAARFFWSSLFGDISWVKAWQLPNKFCVNNKIKEVSYKILHIIYPGKHVLERFNLNISYTCEFCALEKETILHLFFSLHLL